MKIHINRKIIMKITLASLLATSVGNALAQNGVAAESVVDEGQQFKDVKADFHAFHAIHWASESGIIKGYTDGTYKPNNKLTEAQFATILARYYSDLGEDASKYTHLDSELWSNSVYESLARYNVPLLGYTDNSYRNNPVRRGLIAQVFSHLQGGTHELEGAIGYLFDEGITVGQNNNGKTILEQFGHTNHLTRAQAVLFFHRMHEQGKTAVAENVVRNKIINPNSKNPAVLEEEKKKIEQGKKELVGKVDKTIFSNKNVTITLPGTIPPVTVGPTGTKPTVVKPNKGGLPEGKKPEKVVTDKNRKIVDLFESQFGKDADITTDENMVFVRTSKYGSFSYNYYEGNTLIMYSDKSLETKAFTIMQKLGFPLSESELKAAYKDSFSKRRSVIVKGIEISSFIDGANIQWK